MQHKHPIVIVEDDDSLREEISTVLKKHGYTIYSANEGKKAMQVLEPLRASCVLLVDLMMPQVDGWELISMIRDHSERHELNHHIILISGSESVEQIARQEGTGYLSKPFTVPDLLRVLEAYDGAL